MILEKRHKIRPPECTVLMPLLGVLIVFIISRHIEVLHVTDTSGGIHESAKRTATQGAPIY